MGEHEDGQAAIREWAHGKAAELRAKADALRPTAEVDLVGTDPLEALERLYGEALNANGDRPQTTADYEAIRAVLKAPK